MLARTYLPDESDHAAALELLEDDETICMTGTWTRIEVSGVVVRAARAGRGQIGELLAVLDGDLGPDGPVTVLAVSQADVEERALDIVRTYGLRAMDAWHLATAIPSTAGLVEPGEEVAFASRDEDQGRVARHLGLGRWYSSAARYPP